MRVSSVHFGVVVLFWSLTALAPSTGASAPPASIDLSSFPAALMEDVVVPVPGEIFSVLDKLGSPRWSDQLRRNTSRPSGDRAQTALLLGTVIADGFIAVEAMDEEQVKEIGREVLKLSAAIGVRESVLARSNSIIEAADAHDWPLVRREFDGAMQDVRHAMIELRDDQLAHLVSLGGWIRGTEVLTNVVIADFSTDGAELLRQPDLMGYFQRKIDGMNPRLKENQLVRDIRRQLSEMLPLISVPPGAEISRDSVEKIQGITSKIITQISSGEA